MKYYSIGQFAKAIGKTTKTLRNWDKNGKLKPVRVEDTGYRYYSQEQLNHFLGLKLEKQINKKIIGYCRVSSHKQKDDLERQIENVKTYMYAKGYQFEIITDIGSGINYNKKGLKDLYHNKSKTATVTFLRLNNGKFEEHQEPMSDVDIVGFLDLI